ncbi:MAG: hypothetical protein JNL96_25605 [Planctomycetaceae bacterium]|nr:hypothetical protein [Planctomycetaceae bacterium]
MVVVTPKVIFDFASSLNELYEHALRISSQMTALGINDLSGSNLHNAVYAFDSIKAFLCEIDDKVKSHPSAGGHFPPSTTSDI